ncbi:MAG: TIGR02302 family protein [Bauldia sp.]
MSIEPPRPLRLQPAQDEAAVRERIARAVGRARLALLWEDLWPRLILPLVVVTAFLAVSWFGLWIGMPEWLRIGLLGLFGLAGLASLVPLFRLHRPSEAAALARVEQATGTPHRPATAVLDRLGAQHDDPATQAIWAAHRARLLGQFGTLRAGTPSPGVPRRDPYALRFLVVLLAAIAFFAASSNPGDRIADAFRAAAPAAAAAAIDARVDAWAAPPAYTRRPPVFLTGETMRAAGPIAVPAGTEVIVRFGGDDQGLTVVAGASDAALSPVAGVEVGEATEHRVTLADAAVVSVRGDGDVLHAWQFDVIPDAVPTIAFASDPTRTNANALRVEYAIGDDYGVTAARGELVLADPLPPDVRPLIAPPELALALPPGDGTAGEGALVRDLTAHPWAGLPVTLTLVATDAIGQEGRSEARSFILPPRSFTNPLARALIEQRRELALDANRRYRVASALDILALAPEQLPSTGAYLALRSVYHRLVNARSDQDLVAVVDYLWQVAVALEDDPLAEAAAELQAATEALRDALDRNAPQEEIQALLEELRDAMARYMEEMAREAAGDPLRGTPADAEAVAPEQLDDILQELQDRAEAGDREAAQQLLDELDQMMQGMQMGNLQDLQQPPEGTEEALRELGDIINEQQRLRDETFALQQQQNAPMPTPLTDEEARQLLEQLRTQREGEQAQADQLREQQQTLDAQLGRLMDEMEELGFLEPDNTLGAAREDMAAAGQALGAGDTGTAVAEQGQALDNLQGGAQNLAQTLLNQQGGENPDREGGAGAGDDPFGRPVPTEGPDYGEGVEVPEQIDRQRAGQILDLIRERLEELGRPQLERDYLERLLDAFRP